MTLHQTTPSARFGLDFEAFSKGLYIGGEWRSASGGASVDVVDPSTETVVASVPDATLDDAKAAVELAKSSFGKGTAPWNWIAKSPKISILPACADTWF